MTLLSEYYYYSLNGMQGNPDILFFRHVHGNDRVIRTEINACLESGREPCHTHSYCKQEAGTGRDTG